MANLSYLESITKRHNSYSLYKWVKQNPKKNISEIYDNKTSSALLKRADRFQKWFKKYPGDGVLFFHDDLLSPLSEVNPKYVNFSHIEEYNKFFNYLYSFASSFTIKSRGALTIFLIEYPVLVIPLYKYRKNFDPKAFTELIENMNVYRSFNEYLHEDAGKYITQFIWEAILSHKVTLTVCDTKIFLYLYYGYTYTAIQRFFLLSERTGNSAASLRAEIKEHITSAYDMYKETSLLLDCWREDINGLYFETDRRIPQMSSIKAMERFHDLKTEELLEQQRAFDTCKYTWETLSQKIKEVSPEWYLPEYKSDIQIRGQQHHNCVGGYVDRHYNSVENNFKMLLLFTDFCEAELHFEFGECTEEGKVFLGCIRVIIQQAKTAYNANISRRDLSELKEVIKVFLKQPAADFNPVCIER